MDNGRYIGNLQKYKHIYIRVFSMLAIQLQYYITSIFSQFSAIFTSTVAKLVNSFNYTQTTHTYKWFGRP